MTTRTRDWIKLSGLVALALVPLAARLPLPGTPLWMRPVLAGVYTAVPAAGACLDPFAETAVVSPTQLEDAASCPFRHFLKRGLRIEAIESGDRDRDVWLEPGEMIVVPRGVEHRPVAPEEVHVILIEPASTLNTGNLRNERTYEATRA